MRSVFVPLLSVALSFDLVTSRAIPNSHILHEKKDVTTSQWTKHARVESNAKLPVRIGLKQNPEAMEKVTAWLMEVSHPTSEKYGQRWTNDQVTQAFRPTDQAIEKVKAWLTTVIDERRITHTDNMLWFAFDATTAELEQLVHAEYYEHRHENGKSVLSTDEYYVPKDLQEHIDYITPGVHGIQVASKGVNKRSIHSRPPKVHKQSKPATKSGQDDTSHCDTQISPACVRALYQFQALDPNTTVSSSNSMGIFEEGDKYAQGDLNQFYVQYTPYIPKGFGPSVDLIDGATAPAAQRDAGVESDLDFDLAIPIIYPQTTTLYQTDDDYSADSNQYDGFLNTFFDAIDGSYCTYSAYGETGNDPKLDPQYPDSNGYQGQLQCGAFKPTNVISISYGGQESDLPPYYQQRQCNEFLKLGMQGVSIFVASGDDGVQGPKGACLGDLNQVFSPAFPNSCPWLTNVGATALYRGQTVNDPETAAQDLTDGYASGGGFSNIYSMPDYQKTAVNAYFSAHNPLYPSYSGQSYGTGLYNRTGRRYPDVSANGLNTAEYNQGKFILEGGTSASTPIFAALITRVNEERIAAGKTPVGFVNPTLYANSQVLNDITSGSNPGCKTDGFQAVSGWDPVTGLGTPNYPKLRDLFLGLK